MTRLSALVFCLPLLLSMPASAAEEEAAWAPDDGRRSSLTRTPPTFEGMAYLFPLRLHLIRGGYLDGTMGGVDRDRGELLLVLPTATLEIDLGLIDAVTPLGILPAPGSEEAAEPAPAMLTAVHTEYRLRPTWRSGLGLALSFLLPGTGQFIQEDRKDLGFLFLGGAGFFVAGGLLALFAPSAYGPNGRVAVSSVMFGLAGTVAIGAGVHAWQAGRRRVPVEVKGARQRHVD
jgi:hypothetical protein